MFACAHPVRGSASAAAVVRRKARSVLRKSTVDGPTPWSRLATSVRVSSPDDASEREADRVADAVTGHGGIGRLDGAASGIVRRASNGNGAPRHQPPGGDTYLGTLDGRGQPLPQRVRGELEPRFGFDFSGVRLHTDSEAAQSARDFDALAYTYDRHVVFGAGQFDAASAGGRRLIAHELAHVVQQSGSGAGPAVQRKGPFDDFKPDVCVTPPGLGQICGSGAAKVCGKMPSLPGCSTVCRVFDCPKSTEPTTICPPGWKGTTAKGFEGQCCRSDIASAQNCCPPSRIATNESVAGRCCTADEVVVDQKCVKSKDVPPMLPTCLPPSKPNLLGKCCFPPEVPQGIVCGIPVEPKPKPPAPTPALPVIPPIFFEFDRPATGESSKSFDKAATKEGKANFDALVKTLTDDPSLKVQLVGRASPEGGDDYNTSLAGRRAQMVADALEAAGISRSRIVDAPSIPPGAGCSSIGAGISTCGKTGATGPRDRQVTVRLHSE